MDFHIARKKMVNEQLLARGISDPHVIEVMSRTPRHEFVDSGMTNQAYQDHPLNIGLKQTISQPHIVAFMTQALELTGQEKVLEIGTGSGYQTAILSQLTKKVYSIERLTSLSNKARRTFYRLGLLNITLRIGDGTLGWPEESPYDAIIVTAASPHVPEAYLNQLAEGGRLVIPVGSEEVQTLIRIRKKSGRLEQEKLTECRFVKLVGQYGWQEI
ncbi:MAG: protein-L-isoaspartate(D-aspartate) O-methyltransferase [Deltaproteobacteria bacterium]|nr:MAG: protein-L-isoaspartate(D-aspartate) O-methyltransferase [Deltaproteobacteria bacterium]